MTSILSEMWAKKGMANKKQAFISLNFDKVNAITNRKTKNFPTPITANQVNSCWFDFPIATMTTQQRCELNHASKVYGKINRNKDNQSECD